MLRTQLYADPSGRFVHDVVLETCQRLPGKTALVDTSCGRAFTCGEYAEHVESLARGLVAAGLQPGEVVAILLPNSWEFAITYHAATLAGAVPTLLNPAYREREIRYQLEDSGAVFLITDAPLLKGVNLTGLPELRRVYSTRDSHPGAEDFSKLLKLASAKLLHPNTPSQEAIAALPYSSGTTGLPKGVMLTHHNLVTNVYQLTGPGCAPYTPAEVVLCFLPLYHIYGLNVVLNPRLMMGHTLVLMPRFDLEAALRLQFDVDGEVGGHAPRSAR